MHFTRNCSEAPHAKLLAPKPQSPHPNFGWCSLQSSSSTPPLPVKGVTSKLCRCDVLRFWTGPWRKGVPRQRNQRWMGCACSPSRNYRSGKHVLRVTSRSQNVWQSTDFVEPRLCQPQAQLLSSLITDFQDEREEPGETLKPPVKALKTPAPTKTRSS